MLGNSTGSVLRRVLNSPDLLILVEPHQLTAAEGLLCPVSAGSQGRVGLSKNKFKSLKPERLYFSEYAALEEKF